MDYEPDNPLPSLEHQAFENYFNVEAESMAAEGYETSNQVTLRYTALNVILEVSDSDLLFGSCENEGRRNENCVMLRIKYGEFESCVSIFLF